jgi:hypothetical protein
MLRGRLPLGPQKGDDFMQLGGDFVVDVARRLVYAYPSANATDRPAADELVRAVAACGLANAPRLANK